MSKYLVIVFPDVSKAYEGARGLRELHTEGNLTVYAAGILSKDADGKVSIKAAVDEGPVGMALGMLTGSLIGVLGGPAGVVLGMAGGGLLGSIADLDNAGVNIDFVSEVGQRMSPGSVAVVAEAEEYWLAPLDTRMGAIGGTVYRKWRVDFVDQQYEKEIQAWNAELDQLDAELAQAADDAKAAIKSRMDEVKASLKEAQTKARDRIQKLEDEASAKIKELKGQAANASEATKAKIEKRIDEVRDDYNARVALLKQASELTKKALT